MQYKINLVANVPLRQELQGKTFVLVSTGAAPTIDLKIEIQGFANEEMRGVKSGFKINAPGFTSCLLTASVNCTVEVVTSFADISINTNEGSSVQATIVGTPTVIIGSQPVSVVPDRGAPANPVYVAGITYNDAPASSRNDNAPIAVGPVAVLLLAANASRKEVRICNLDTDEIAVGGPGITWEKRVIVLAGADTFFDDRAASLAVYAITNAGKSTRITTQEIIA